eukprot:CAMPEP_0118633582 /NCGR_PEP_ID=MMETSP0785-20121206/1077_1 /TAXON_ID=91992 /ORGANISM="Bolidomonas pacifica, Strain CCMP 1866" /LENGTH=401 /DNA_ID=CAMNT_0006524473 /DNA_START=145 /DNA_END=1347 /DNA_ORIENTATION=+
MNYKRMIRKQLVDICLSRRLSGSGTKAVLIERLEEYDEEENLLGGVFDDECSGSDVEVITGGKPVKRRILDLQSDEEESDIEVEKSLSAGEALQKKFQQAAASGAVLDLDDETSLPLPSSQKTSTTKSSSTTSKKVSQDIVEIIDDCDVKPSVLVTPLRFPKGYKIKKEREAAEAAALLDATKSPKKKQKVLDLSLDDDDDDDDIEVITPATTPDKKGEGLPIIKDCLMADGVGREDRLYLWVEPDEKKDAWGHGCRWDKETQCFYATGNSIEFTSDEYPHMKDPKAKVYLEVPFHFKEKAKSKGAQWDQASKSWFIHRDAPVRKELVKCFKNGSKALKCFLNITFHQKDDAKEKYRGYIFWDQGNRAWFCWKGSKKQQEILNDYGEKDLSRRSSSGWVDW